MSSMNYAAYNSAMAHRRQAPAVTPVPGSTSTLNFRPQHFLRSRSLSPSEPRQRPPRAYAVVGATQCGVVIGPMLSKPSPRPAQSLNTPSDTPMRYISPFISTKSRPSLYQRAISDSPEVSTGGRGRSRSRSTAGNPGTSNSTPVLSTPSFAGAMMPPFMGYQCHNDEENGYRRDSDASSRCSSRASTTHSATISNTTGKRSFVAKLKSVLKGSAGDGTETNILYLTPEEAREREIRIKKAFHGHPISTGGLGI